MNLTNIEIVEISGINSKDCPDFSDAYVTEAFYKDSGVHLTDDELDILNENGGCFIHEHVMNRVF
jgi:spermidine synthase